MMHKEIISEDLRVKRTQKLILNALLELTVQKGFSAMTVSDIAKYAGINRATFYRHYTDKGDLLNQYTQTIYHLLDALSESGLEKSNETDVHRIPVELAKIFEHVRQNAKFYRVMLGKNGDPVFLETIREYIKKRIRRSLPKILKKDDMSIDLYIQYSANASIGAVLWWLEHDMPYSSEKMVKILELLESGNLTALRTLISG